MKDLHPEAKALIEAARQAEAVPSPEALTRIHRSVVQRAAALAGAAAVTASAGASAKAAVSAALVTKLIVSGVAGVALSVGLIATHPTWTTAPRRPAMEARSVGPERAPAPPRSAVDARPAVPAAPNKGDRSLAADRPAASVHASATAARTDQHAAARRSGPPHSPAPSQAHREIVASGGQAPAAPVAAAIPVRATQSGEPRADSVAAAAEAVPAAATDLAPRVPAEPAARGAAPQVPTPAPAHPDLATELNLLERVHTALRRGQPERALALLQRHEAIVQGGSLEQQARAAAISALCQLGREKAARAAFERFQDRWPRTPLAIRLQSGCAKLTGD